MEVQMKRQFLITVEEQYVANLLGFIQMMKSGQPKNAIDVQEFTPEQIEQRVRGLIKQYEYHKNASGGELQSVDVEDMLGIGNITKMTFSRGENNA
jgi:hypothetical protein